jgi:nucleoside phosphorylase
MKRFLFITANENERDAFEKKYIRRETKYFKGKSYCLGMFGNYPAAYIHIDEQGVTSPAAMSLAGELARELRPVAVVMAGIAFGADENTQKIGDVLVSDKILPYDSQRILEGKTEYKEIPKEVGFQLLNAFREHREWVYYLPGALRSNVIVGAMLTGSRLVNNYGYRSKLIEDFAVNKPIGGEMEAQGVYSACRLHGIAEWIIVKAICDWGYNKENPNKKLDQITAATAAVDFCLHVFLRDGVFDHLMESRYDGGINGRGIDSADGAVTKNNPVSIENLTINNVKGDVFNDNASIIDFGKNNTFGNVKIAKK